MSQKDIATLAYLAGIIDGEGSISISGAQMSDWAHGKHGKYYQIQLHLGMQNRAPLDLLSETFQGSYTVRQDTIYRIGYSSRKAGLVIRELMPYMRVKKPQAELALLFQSLRKRIAGRAYTPEERDRDAAFHKLMSELNRRDAQAFYDQNGINSAKVPLRYRKENAERSPSGTTYEILAEQVKAEADQQPMLFMVEGEGNV